MKKFINDQIVYICGLIIILFLFITYTLITDSVNYKRYSDLQNQIITINNKLETLENIGTNESQSEAIKNIEKRILILESNTNSTNPDLTDIEMEINHLEERIIDLEEN